MKGSILRHTQFLLLSISALLFVGALPLLVMPEYAHASPEEELSILWSKSEERDPYRQHDMTDVAATGDGGYVVTGRKSGVSITRFDGSGSVIWDKTEKPDPPQVWQPGTPMFSGSFESVVVTNERNIYAMGSGINTYNGCPWGGRSGYANRMIVKYDIEGNLLWAKTVDIPGVMIDLVLNTIVPTSDDGCIVVGAEGVGWRGPGKELIVRYDKNGDIIWTKAKQGAESGGFKHATVDSNDNLVVTRYSREGSTPVDKVFVKYDVSGNLIWEKTFNHSSLRSFKKLCATSDGGFALLARTTSNRDIIFKFSTSGDAEWEKDLIQGDDYTDLILAADGGFIVTGSSSGNIAAVIAKYSPTGDFLCSEKIQNPDYGEDYEDYEGRFVAVTQVADGEYVGIGDLHTLYTEYGDGADKDNDLMARFKEVKPKVSYRVEYRLKSPDGPVMGAAIIKNQIPESLITLPSGSKPGELDYLRPANLYGHGVQDGVIPAKLVGAETEITVYYPYIPAE